MDLHPGEEILLDGRPSWRATLGLYAVGSVVAVIAGVIAGVAGGTAIGVAVLVAAPRPRPRRPPLRGCRPMAAVPETSGRRCFGDGDPLYERYHDEEWGRTVADERGLFERMSLEAFQSGLSWLTILRKREAFRAAFAGFEPAAVAGFGDEDVARLLGHAGIVRNRAKIEATIANARATVALHESGASLRGLVWEEHRPPPRPAPPRTWADVPAQTPETVALAKDLKRRGFRFVGPTTLYALMQACGVVDDHLADCPVRLARAAG